MLSKIASSKDPLSDDEKMSTAVAVVEEVGTRVERYSMLIDAMNNLSINEKAVFPRDKAGNMVIPGTQFAPGHPDVRVGKSSRGTVVVDVVGASMALTNSSNTNTLKKIKKLQEQQDGVYESLVEDLEPDEREVTFKYIDNYGIIREVSVRCISLLRGFPKLIMITNGPVANDLKSVMAEIVSRYKAGDKTMIKEIIANSEKTDPVTLAMKAALAAERCKKRPAVDDEDEQGHVVKYNKVVETLQTVVMHLAEQKRENEELRNMMKLQFQETEELKKIIMLNFQQNKEMHEKYQAGLSTVNECSQKLIGYIEPPETSNCNEYNTIYTIANDHKLYVGLDYDVKKKIRSITGLEINDPDNEGYVKPLRFINKYGCYEYREEDIPAIIAKIKEVKQRVLDDEQNKNMDN